MMDRWMSEVVLTASPAIFTSDQSFDLQHVEWSKRDANPGARDDE